MTSLLFYVISAQLLLAGVEAQNRFCNQVRSSNRYNASTETAIPALTLNNTTLVASPDQEWNLFANLHSTSPGAGMSSAVTSYFLNTGDSNTDHMAMCLESAQAWDNGFYLFSKKVLARAAKDKAGNDCKGMFGEQCVEALKRHLQRNALQYMQKGACPTIDPEEPTSIVWNQTVPYECSDFVGGDDAWNENLSADTGNLTSTIADIFQDHHCTIDAGELAANVHPLGNVAGSYNQSIRFAFPTFLTFFPNLTSIQASSNTSPTPSVNDVYVEVLCLVPDNVREGSLVPPTVQELLGGEMKFGENVTDTEGTEEPDVSAVPSGSGSGAPAPSGTETESTGGVGPVRTAAPMLGAMGLAALLLV